MTWQDWLLIYLGGGVLFIGIRMVGEGDGRDARDLFFTLLIYPIFPFSYVWYRYTKRKREQERQTYIAEQVRDGTMTAADARDHYKWNGKEAK